MMNENQTTKNEGHRHYGMYCHCGDRKGIGLGVLLLVVGGYFLLQDLGYISSDVSFWPIVAVAFGLYFLARGISR